MFVCLLKSKYIILLYGICSLYIRCIPNSESTTLKSTFKITIMQIECLCCGTHFWNKQTLRHAPCEHFCKTIIIDAVGCQMLKWGIGLIFLIDRDQNSYGIDMYICTMYTHVALCGARWFGIIQIFRNFFEVCLFVEVACCILATIAKEISMVIGIFSMSLFW